MNVSRLIALVAGLCLALPPSVTRADSIASILVGKDNSIFENATGDSAGGGPGVFSGANGSSSKRRGLLYFDIASSVPAGSVITGVELSMYLGLAPNTTNQIIGLHPLSLSWGEGTAGTGVASIGGNGNGFAASGADATWANRFSASTTPPAAAVPWPTVGAAGSYNAAASGTAVVGGAIDTQKIWSSTPALIADVQGWLNNPATNFGWALINAAEGSQQSTKAFYSKEATLANGGAGPAALPASWRPTLTITYVPEPTTAMLMLLMTSRLAFRRPRHI